MKIYYVRYAGSFYKLRDDGTAVEIDESLVTDYEVVDADVIASWKYVHKLIEDNRESLEGDLKAYPDEDTIHVRYFEDYSGQLTLDIRVDVSTVRTTMRKRMATLIESIAQLKKDLVAVTSTYVVDMSDSSINEVILSFVPPLRHAGESVKMTIDTKSGAYTTDLWKRIKTIDFTYCGVTLRDFDMNVVFTNAGVRKVGPGKNNKIRSSYIASLVDEWGDILAFLRRSGFSKEVTDSHQDEVWFKRVAPPRITVVFSYHREQMTCIISNFTDFDLTGRHDVDTLAKCIASVDTALAFDSSPNSLWSRVDGDQPWKLTLFEYGHGDDVVLATVDAGRIVYAKP